MTFFFEKAVLQKIKTMTTTTSTIPSERQQYVLKAIANVPSAQEILGGQEAMSSSKIQVSVLSGGITNELYRVKNTESGKSVVVRIYGKETERLISRSAEQFFQSKFLKTFGRYESVLIYEFLDGMRSLEPDELPQHAEGVAKTLAHFHCNASTFALYTPPYATQELHCINVTKSWIQTARHAVDTIPKLAEFKEDVAKLEAACAFIQPLLHKLKAHVPVVICHNDLLSGNVMVYRDDAGEDKKIAALPRLIDFEYCRRDFALYDIANHWHEWAGYDNDFTKYPNKETQTKFLKAYFNELAKATNNNTFPEEVEALCSDAAIERARIITNFLFLAAVLTWSIWSMVQHAYSEIEFDYLDYYRKKFARFNEMKEEYTTAVKEIGLI